MADNINDEIEEQYEEYDEELEEILNESPRKSKKKTPRRIRNRRILIFIILAVLAAGILYYINTHSASKSEIVVSSDEVDENSYNGSNIMRVDLNQISKINIDLKTADVRIQKSNTNPYIEYTHLYRGEEDIYSLDVSYENGVLNLATLIEGQELNMKNKIQIVRIFLPSDQAIDEITAKIDAGDVKVSDLEVRNLDLKVRSGHITFENSFFGGSVQNEIGDIILDKSELLNTKLATNVGDIVINEGKLGPRSEFSTQSGDITIAATDSLDNYNVRAKLEVGNFILGNISYRNIKDGFRKDIKAPKDINLSTKVGDIVFNKGEGAILEEEEYITNEGRKKPEDERSSQYQYEDELEETEEDPAGYEDPINREQETYEDDATTEEENTDGIEEGTEELEGENNGGV